MSVKTALLQDIDRLFTRHLDAVELRVGHNIWQCKDCQSYRQQYLAITREEA